MTKHPYKQKPLWMPTKAAEMAVNIAFVGMLVALCAVLWAAVLWATGCAHKLPDVEYATPTEYPQKWSNL